MKRKSSITFRVSGQEKERIAAKAKSVRFTTSDFCRHAALGKEVVHIEGLGRDATTDYPQLTKLKRPPQSWCYVDGTSAGGTN